jgi:hypothetical protein
MFSGQGKDSNLRYDLRRIAALASCCLKPLSHLSSTSYFTQPVPNFGNAFLFSGSAIQPAPRSLGYSGTLLTFLLLLSTHEQSAAESVV